MTLITRLRAISGWKTLTGLARGHAFQKQEGRPSHSDGIVNSRRVDIAGDRTDIEYLFYQRYYPQLKAAAEARVRDPEVAEDIAQAAFWRAAGRAPVDGRSLRGYSESLVNHLRFELDRLADDTSELTPVDSTYDSQTAERFAEYVPGTTAEAEAAAEVAELVGSLTGRPAEIYRLHLDGLGEAEIASRLKMHGTAVARNLEQARSELWNKMFSEKS